MLKVINKENINSKLVQSTAKKLRLDIKDFDLVAYDRFFASYIFLLAVANKKVYVYCSDSKKNILEFAIRDFDNISIQNKLDLNLYLKSGKVINLTSVVGVKPKVMSFVSTLNAEINKLK